MPAQILATKYYIPSPGPGIVPRARLFALLDEGLKHRFTLISAPAGYGKTTLLSAWIADRQARSRSQPQAAPSDHFCWLSLDTGDNDPQRFLSYLITAIQSASPRVGQSAASLLQSPNPPEIDAALAQLLNDLSLASERIILVLDDFFLVQEEPVHRLLANFIERMPPQVNLYLATRSDPVLPLARLRVSDRLCEMRGDELRFTIPEAGELFKRSMGLELSQAEITSLVARTEGWAAGLQMAGLTLQNRPDTSGFITSFTGSNRYIFDYLVEEVLARQTPQVRGFLLKTSILDHLCAPLCQTLMDEPFSVPSAEILAYLERSNLFLIPLGNDRTWYRYHPLFADLLRAILHQTQPNQIPALYLCASHWYEKQGVITEAIHYALAGGDIERVARLVAGNVLALVEHDELNLLLRQIQALPESDPTCQPWLCVAQAWAMAYAGKLLEIEPLLRRVEEDLDAPAARVAGLRGHIAAIRAYVEWIQGNFECAIDLAWQADGFLLDNEPAARALNLTTLGTSLPYCGKLHQAAQVLAQAVQLSRRAGETHVTLLAGASLAYVQLELGELHQAQRVCRELLELAGQYAQRSGSLMPAACSVYAVQSAILCEWNDLEAALLDARQGLELGLKWGQADSLTVNYLYLSRVLSASGDMAGAREMLLNGKQVAGRVSLWFHDLVSTFLAELHLKQGEMDEVIAWSRERRLSPDAEISYSGEGEYRTLAWLLIEQGRAAEALIVLERVLQVLEPSGSVRSTIQALLLQALAYQAADNPESALVSLDRALSLGEAGGFLRSYLNPGEPMRQLLTNLRAREASRPGSGDAGFRRRSSCLERILSAFPVADMQPSRPAGLPVQPAGMVEQISEREMEVLRYLAGHLTVPEIASALYVSPYTVRSHVKSIYGKLGVHNRSQAVQCARVLGLL